MRFAIATIVLVACGGSTPSPDAPAPLVPTANPEREIVDTKLAFDVTATTGTATITFGPSEMPGATLEVGELVLGTVMFQGAELAYATNPPDMAAKNATGSTIDLALPPSGDPMDVTIAFTYKAHAGGFTGASAKGYTFLWPYFCGNLFPCHSSPSDGTTMSLELSGVPDGKVAVFAPTIVEAPSYQLAWAIDAYTELPLGTTTAGTQVSVWHLPNEATTAMNGTQNLVAVFDWLEKNIGPYRFGNKVGSVSVKWGAGAYGGMEHHPMWHVGASSLGSQETHAHEAAHGWFGDGIRLSCWEDFVLSEGTVSYLSARALSKTVPAMEAKIWADYQVDLDDAIAEGGAPAWPHGCNQIDIVEDKLFTNLPYMQGAFFYKEVADKVGADVLDGVIGRFYKKYKNKPAGMQDMVNAIKTETGFDPQAIVDARLRKQY